MTDHDRCAAPAAGAHAHEVGTAPRLRDEWAEDAALQACLQRLLPADVLDGVRPELAAMGRLAAGELHDLHLAMDRRDREPRLVRYDAWGRRVDRIEIAPEWERIGAVAIARGLVATAYERRHGPWSRVHQFALAHLFNPSSALCSCPLAMTDGAARTLQQHAPREIVERAVPRLTSRDPRKSWSSGQWMTERTGGSDVGRTATVAVRDGDVWRLHGVKWFTSAVTADVALALARPEGNPPGSRGLALFYVEVADGHGRWQDGIRVLRLKDKLGTRQLATAELELDGAVAHLVGAPEGGVRRITPMLAITRLWNAVSATAGMRRAYSLARDYATRREVFGRLLIDQPLHQAVLAGLRVQHAAALQLTFRAADLLGRDETGGASDDERAVLRLLVPVAKLVTARQAVAVASEALEAFGGAGYVEDTHLPHLLRDAQVLPIWEGTTNVLALDAVRAARRDGALAPFVEEVRRQAAAATHPGCATVGRQAVQAAEAAARWFTRTSRGDAAEVEHGARRWAMTLGRALQAALLAAQGQHDADTGGDGRGAAAARRFAAAGIDLLAPGAQRAETAALARDEPLKP